MSIIGGVGIRGKIALSVALCSLVWVVLLVGMHGDMRSDPQFALPMDHHKYLAMAQQDVGAFRIAPFCWRIGAPAVAHLIGGDPWTVMLGLTTLGLVLVMCSVALLVWDATSSWINVVGVSASVLAMGWLTRSSVWNPATVDILACGLMMLSVYLATRNAWMWSALVLCCGVLVKESALLALPIAFVVCDHASWKRLLVWSLPAMCVVAIVRAVIPAGNADAEYLATLPETLRLVQNGTSTYSLSYLISTVATERVLHPSVSDIWALTGDSVGLVVLVLLGCVAWSCPTRRWPLVVVCGLAAGQVLLAVNIQRVVLMAGPALAGIGWMYLPQTQLHWASKVLLYLACGMALLTTLGSRVSPPMVAHLASLAVVGIAIIVHRRRLHEGINHA